MQESELEFEDPYGDDFEVEDVEKHQRQKKGRRVQPNVAASASAMAEDGDGFESTSDEDDETLGAELEDPSTDGSEDEDGPKSHGPRKVGCFLEILERVCAFALSPRER